MDEMEISNQSNSKKNYGIEIPLEIIEELKRIEKRITELADGDNKFISNIVEYSLLLCKGKGIYIDNIKKLVWKKYPDIRTDLKLEGKSELFKLVYNLSQIIVGKHKLTQDYISKNAPKREGWIDFQDQFRELIEEEVNRIFYPGGLEDGESESGIIGNITEQLNDMEI
jgi:hypothetical protein